VTRPSLIVFAATGNLGELHRGLTQDRVRELLGEPDDVSLPPAEVWRYGSLEVSFDDGLVVLLAVELAGPSSPTGLPPALDVFEDLDRESLLPAVYAALRERGAIVELDAELMFETQAALVVHAHSRITVVFDERCRLDSILATAPATRS
jgi:hypothetical protein